MNARSTAKKNAGGRPRKFAEPSHPITVTLPENTLAKLSALDPDRAKAIVKCADMAAGGNRTGQEPINVVEVAPGKAIILVGPSNSLKRIKWLRMVQVAPFRYLLTIPTGTPVESLEVAILDTLENLSGEEATERPLLESLKHLISHQRRKATISKNELLFIDI
jgi:hypothetical protein